MDRDRFEESRAKVIGVAMTTSRTTSTQGPSSLTHIATFSWYASEQPCEQECDG